MRFVLMVAFFGAAFLSGYSLYREMLPMKSWKIYLIFAGLFVVAGGGIVLIRSNFRWVAVYLLAVSILVLYLRLNDAFKAKLAQIDAREQKMSDLKPHSK